MKRIHKLKEKVLKVLATDPPTRDSDIRLCIAIWERYYPEFLITGSISGDKAVKLRNLFELPREDHVKRIRAQIQNDEGRYLPTSWEVAKQRKINEERWREYISHGGA